MRQFALLLLLVLAQPLIAAPLTGPDRAEVIRNSARVIEERYVDASLGKRVANELRRTSRQWDGLTDPDQFAKAVTQWLRTTSGDGHLGLSYSEQALPEEGGEASFSAAEMEKWYGRQLNHGIEKIERLPGNVMLLDLRVFPPPAMAGDVFAAAMTVAAQGDALIVDLRNNGGGTETANLFTGYLLEGGSPLSGIYSRPSDTYRANTSPSWVPGRRFGTTRPVYILTSRRTFSAAEAVAYDLQALRRAVIIGEVTGGGAHPFEYRRVHAHFALDLPESRSINPLTKGNWQGVGVKPDIPVPASQALEKALELAREATGKDR